MDLFPGPSPQSSVPVDATGRPRHVGVIWPEDLLQHFCLRMSFRGMCVSRALMVCDHRYALEQLVHAHNMTDDGLQRMAAQLFRHFEASQPGLNGVH